MGIGNFGLTELIIILVIVAVIFGTAKLRNMGGDLGSALRSFRKGLSGDSGEEDAKEQAAEKAPAATKTETQAPVAREAAAKAPAAKKTTASKRKPRAKKAN